MKVDGMAGDVCRATPKEGQEAMCLVVRQPTLCKYFAQGRCTWGALCRFAHLPMKAPSMYPASAKPGRYKTQICRHRADFARKFSTSSFPLGQHTLD